MEHLIITGGDKLLPFARSRVKALRATGLSHASQSYIINGFRVRVKLAGAHEYIFIEGGGESVFRMNSGVVDLVTWFGLEPTRYNPGILHETSGVAAYHAPFVPAGEWREKPGTASDGQIAGKLTFGTKNEFKGRVPYNAQTADSFKPKTIPDTSTDPEGWMADPADDAMVGKKAIADYCPPSIFTGKTRLYVQALYGAPLYTEDVKDAEGNITKAGVPAESIVSYDEGIGGTPSIKLAPYRAEGDTAEYSPVVLTTGAGVFLDPVTGKHWLFGTGGSGVSVYPLRASPEATKLRRLLKIPAKGKPVLSIVDREHLEAYILSTCRPDVKNVQYLPFPTSINTWSLGYSWHWNWTGLTADIVNNEDFFQGFFPGGPCYAMRSTHRRLAITPSQLPEGGTEFTVSVSVVEGPKEWAVERALWCLTEPYWANGSSLKVTPRRTKIFACDAPFYAFYIRDQLKVCRVSVTEGFDYSERITSPGFDSSIAGPYYTEGAGGGFGESKSFSGTYYAASFSCGGKSFSSLHAYRSESGTLDVISGKGEGDPFWGTVDVFRAPGFSVSVGSPGNYSEFTYNGSSVNVWYNRLIPMSYTHKASTTSTTYPSRATLVVPHKNAEAFYMEGYSASIRTETGVTVTALSGGLFGQKTQYVEVDFFTGAELGPRLVTAGYYTGGVAYAGATVTGTTNPDDIVTTSVSLSEGVLISHAGVTSARFADDIYFNRFHDDDYEEVPSDFKTLSGTSVAAPVVIANIYINPAIGTSVVPGMPALVGWV